MPMSPKFTTGGDKIPQPWTTSFLNFLSEELLKKEIVSVEIFSVRHCIPNVSLVVYHINCLLSCFTVYLMQCSDPAAPCLL